MADDTIPHAKISIPVDFKIDAITPYRSAEHVYRNAAPTVHALPTPPLGVVANFTGTFSGPGLNLIFRPNSDAPTSTTFPAAVNPLPPKPPSEFAGLTWPHLSLTTLVPTDELVILPSAWP
ncbi:hypothetical protein GCM10007874_09080 [Labrys miyagiensis]|uniref:Uncharacterized protein n=1 Tax=Labrys miyagiensis TaxID=346912 RepID=A0ABQ6CHX5_9HYPH|nr:hypothetical protein [Labrys miyagiensis]GLS17892.1 hypothetical protein GCM10007874_09080 [Labrys miyagiensis]